MCGLYPEPTPTSVMRLEIGRPRPWPWGHIKILLVMRILIIGILDKSVLKSIKPNTMLHTRSIISDKKKSTPFKGKNAKERSHSKESDSSGCGCGFQSDLENEKLE